MRGLLRHQVFRASSLRALALAMGVVASVVVARLGGPDVKGVTSAFAAMSVLAFTAVNLDLAQQTLRHGRTTGSVDLVRGQLLRLWPGYGALAGLVAGIGLLLGSTSVPWLAAGAFAYLISAHLGIACTGLSGPVVTAVGGIVQQVGLAAACLVAAAVGRLDVTWAPLVVIVSFLAPMPLYYWAARPRGSAAGSPSTRYADVRDLVRRGLRWQGARVAQLLLLRLDILWVFWVLGASAAGVYAVGLATAALAGVVPAQFASNTTYEAMRGRSSPLRRNARSAALTGLAVAVVLAAVGWPLLVFAYGREFSGSYGVLLATLPGVVAYGVLQVYTNQTRIVGEARSVTIPSVAGALTMAAALAVATPVWGTAGAGLASSFGPLTALLVIYLLSRRSSRAPLEDDRPGDA